MELTQNINEKTIELQEVDFDPFAGPKLTKIVPTTQSQLEIWLACMIGGNDANRSYNESISLNLKGNLNQEALIKALSTLQERHEILRSTFSPDGKSICIYAEVALNLNVQDISEDDNEVQKSKIDKLHQDDAELCFDLVRGPLLRIYLVKISKKEHLLKISAHHIVCDGWSFGIILENLSAIYNSYVNKTELNLEEPIPYSQYALEIQKHVISNEYAEIEAFWFKQYKGNVPVMSIPTDMKRPEVRTFKSQRSDFLVPKNIIESLKDLGSKKKTSLITTLITALESYLFLLTRQNDIVIGLPASGQSATGNYELVGHCVNLLPLRAKITGNESFLDYLDKRKLEIMDSYDYQQFTFSSLLQKLNIARDSSRVPLVPIIFNVDIGMDANVKFQGLSHEVFSDPRAYENFEIFLNITGTEQNLNFEWSYNTQLFKVETIEKMMGEFQRLLQEIIEDPKIRIKDISVSRDRTLLSEVCKWNKTSAVYPKNKTVADLINESAIKNPAKTAILFNDQEVSYTQLNRQSNQIAHYLIKQGVKRNDTVALVVDRSPEMVIALLGIMKSGATYLPVDSQYPEGRIQFMLDDSDAKLVLVSEARRNSLQKYKHTLILENLLRETQHIISSYPSLETTEDHLAYILYTSGSTGKPKGVQIKHTSLINFMLSAQKEPGIKTDDVLLAISTISFDIAATEIFLPLIGGASVYLASAHTAKDGRALLEVIENKKITIMQATPITWRMMLAAGWRDKIPLKIICTGEAFPKDLVAPLFIRGSELWNCYGPTETTIWSSVKQIADPNDLITIGKPIANTQMYILDEHQSPVPSGTNGEIYIAGDGLAKGYLKRADLTDKLFISTPFMHNTKIYRTGDLGYRLPNGEIVYLGRADAQVKIRGHRIELGEIEFQLCQQNGIKEAVVIANGADKDNQHLVAYIVPDEKDGSGWMERWDDLYTLGIKSEESIPLEEQNLDIAIISQYNTQDDIKEHGREWTQEGLKRIRALKANKILELGTGGGHLLFELASETEKYIATDYSEVAINKLKEKLTLQNGKWDHVEAFKASADDFSSISEKKFDLIFFHGVVQYFPTLDYLVKVLEAAVKHLRDGGCIHIGDSQTLSAISMHFATEQLALLQDKVTVHEFAQIVKYQTEKEEEISIDPGFFYFLPQIIPNITSVDVQIRGGDYSNEATKCHYDIWLYIGENAPKNVTNDIVESWNKQSSVEEIENLLSSNPSKVITVRNIPNQRVLKDYSLSQLMKNSHDDETLERLKLKLNQEVTNGVNPTELWDLGEQKGFKTHIRWANDGSDGNIEVVFIPNELGDCLPEPPSELKLVTEKEYLKAKKNSIEILKTPDHKIHLWRNTLKNLLPEFMIPNILITLNRLPTTENGKIDRKNLPAPDHTLTDGEVDFCPPRNETETIVHDIWCRHLGITSVDIHSNFFELGGHSLIAVRLMLDLEKETGIRLPISVLFQNSTIARLADKIEISTLKTIPNESTINSIKPEILSIPTTDPQKEIWTSCILGGDEANKAYNVSYPQLLHGEIDHNALRCAVQKVVNRHQSLRSVISNDGEKIVIMNGPIVDYQFWDISSLSIPEQDNFIEERMQRYADTLFDIHHGPLFKTGLIAKNSKENLLVISFHHLVCDGFSTSIVMKEISEFYNAELARTNPDIAPVASLSDYSTKINEYYQSTDYKITKRYWLDQFKDEVPLLNLPIDYVRPQRRTYHGARVYFHLQKPSIRKLKTIGFNNGCSISILLRAVFELLLYRICNQKTIVTGLPVAGQLNEENNNLVGHCVNLLPLKTSIDPDISFIDYLNERRNSILEAYNHHNITFSSLLNSLNIKRDTSRLPLTPVFLNVNSDKFEFEFSNIKKENYNTKKLFETFEIALNIDDLQSELMFRWDYNTDLFKQGTIAEFQRKLEELIELFSNAPDSLISETIRIKESDEQSNITKKVAEWNRSTRKNYPTDKSVVEYIDEMYKADPLKTALCFDVQKITYQDLIVRSNQFAHFLMQKGLGKGDILAFMFDRGPEMIITLLGILKAGAAYLPLDPQFPNDRTDFMLSDSDSKLIITSSKHSKRFKNNDQVMVLEEIEAKLSQMPTYSPVIDYHTNDLAYVLYTSGSTGRPKGVQIEMHSLVNFLLSMQQKPGISSSDKLLAVTTISFDIAGLEILLPLISGAEIILANHEVSRNGVKLLNLLEQSSATIMQATPITWYMLLECGWLPTKPFKALCGGESLPKDLIEKLLKLKIDLWNMYGPTETTIWSSTKNIVNSEETITVGKPIDNTQFYILDENQKQVTIGTPGEIYIAGDGLARGYINRPELTEEKFISNPYSSNPNSKMYNTGDTGYFLENGEIVCLGRVDSQVKINGFRIELEEIEYNVNKLTGVKKCIVVVDKENPQNAQIRAYLLLNSQETTLPDKIVLEWKKQLKTAIPDYMVPTSFVVIDRFPTTNNGKIDRKQLGSFKANATQSVRPQVSTPNNTEIEKIVTKIWSEQLSLETLDVDANFFDLGGNSLMAIRTMRAIESETGIRAPISILFEHSTIKSIVAFLTDNKKEKKWQCLVPIKISGTKPPIYLVHGGGFNILTFEPLSKHMDPEQPLFALQGLGLYDKTSLLPTVEKIAEFYIKEMLENDPVGPYVLGGYCSGGILAYEMATQLRKMEKEVSFLAMLDTNYDYPPLDSSSGKLFIRAIKNTFRASLHILKSSIVHPRLTYRYLKNEIEKNSRVFRSKKHITYYEEEVNDAYEEAFAKYRGKPLDVKIILLKAKTRVFYVEDPILYGWKNFALKGIDSYEMEGDHTTFLTPPNEKEFARTFQRLIDENT